MWNRILGLNSFILWPAAAVFMLYAAGRAVLTLQWKMLLLAFVIFVVFTIAEVVLAIMSD
ncbi:MAG: hypothetical protein Athens041674_767 [Parcubacteria group bacterium Athens0416_74]|nr:MAG: hypothetical protein Athens041674_767 [Parcubacteria group bacterium Athens0416_74]